MSNIDLRLGNVLDVLAQMPSESVHCIVTSPPYWGLRAYGTEPQVWRNGSEPCGEHEWVTNAPIEKSGGKNEWSKSRYFYGEGEASSVVPKTTTNTCTRCGAWRGELGLEPTPELFVEHIVAVMREARRVLRADGTMFLNLGDSYWGGKGQSAQAWSTEHTDRNTLEKSQHQITGMGETRPQDGKHPILKPKDLVGIPWRVAFALQADGWYLRSDIIWHKPNPMPESVRDRPTKAHEYIFLLAKQPRYYYDSEAVREAVAESSIERAKYGLDSKNSGYYRDARTGSSFEKTRNGMTMGEAGFVNPAGRNRRSVWTVTTHPYSGAHFATFPPKLIEPCILAATSERGVCSKCGAPWVRETSKEKEWYRQPKERKWSLDDAHGKDGRDSGCARLVIETTGWRASCDCDAGEPVPATVLDPFNGAGTTGLVALQHGRNYIGIDLKQEYLDMTRARLEKAQLVMVTA